MPAADTAYVVHWHPLEVQDRVEEVESKGWDVVGSEAADVDRAADGIVATAPTAAVVWLSHEPEQGRRLLLKVKTRGPREEIPFVFVDGSESAVRRVKEVFPAGIYTDVYHLGDALDEARRTARSMQKAS